MREGGKQPQAAIIGAGQIGSALASVMRKAGRAPALWDKDAGKLKGAEDFPRVVSNATIIFLCVPSWANREVARNILGCIESSQRRIIITLSKGIESESLKTMDEVLKDELGGRADYGVLVGPMLAEELLAGQPATVVFGVSHAEWKKEIRRLFHNTALRAEFSPDLHGLAVCSVLKNIYSLALGMADGLGLGVNVRSRLTLEAYGEMREITRFLGGKRETVQGLAGLGDLLATGWSSLSRNFTAGRDLVLKNERNLSSEGSVSLLPVSRLLGARLKRFRILYSIKQILMDKKDVRAILESRMLT